MAWLEPWRHGLASLQVNVPLPRVHPNVAGGLLAMWLPLQVAALVPRQGRRYRRTLAGRAHAVEISLLGMSCVGLLLSSLRGAWVALVVSVGLWLWWRACDRLAGARGWPVRVALWVGGVGIVALVPLGTPWGAQLLGLRPDRMFVWRNSWDLAWDYFFTGVGLGSFTMAYSSYVLLLHVPYTFHAHNLFLDVWLGQGLVGVSALVWLLVIACRLGRSGWTSGGAVDHSRDTTRWRPAALVALSVIVLHGLLDDVYYGYGGAGALFLFVPLAFLSRRGARLQPDVRGSYRAARIGVWSLAAVAVLAVLAWPKARALGEANLGTLRQTRAELAVYKWPDWPLQDAVRRSDRIDLAPAIEHYRTALAIDPTSAVANRRLGQIELSLGHYEAARGYLEAAYRAAPRQHPTRQMLGESLALTGDVRGAAALWRSIPLEQDQLAIRQYWYRSTNEAQRAQLIDEAIVLARKTQRRP